MDRFGKDFAWLHHPFSCWCAKESVADIYWIVRFAERRHISWIYVQGHPMESKYVKKARIKYENESSEWVHAKTPKNVIVSFIIDNKLFK